jgi:hypothetical protein
MAIRFSCPACQQPLEIDDSWASQSVACPYCRRVVTAPQASTWPAGSVPMAAPGRPIDPQAPTPSFAPPTPQGFGPPPSPGFAPPPPPGYGPQVAYAPRPSGSAGWALGLTIAGAVTLVGLMMVWMGLVYKAAMDTAGPNATQAELQRVVEDNYLHGHFPHATGLVMTGVAAMLASVGGLILGVRSLVRQEPGRGMAITACILGGIFLFCQMLMLVTLAAPRPAS